MPNSEYRCKTCGHTFSQLTFKGDPIPAVCPQCKGKTVEPTADSEGFMAASSLGSLLTRIPKGPS